MTFTVTASRRNRKPIVAKFATRDAAESAATAWKRYFRVTITESE
jgi:hypothetical protein